jgi:hypothetical protein
MRFFVLKPMLIAEVLSFGCARLPTSLCAAGRKKKKSAGLNLSNRLRRLI